MLATEAVKVVEVILSIRVDVMVLVPEYNIVGMYCTTVTCSVATALLVDAVMVVVTKFVDLVSVLEASPLVRVFVIMIVGFTGTAMTLIRLKAASLRLPGRLLQMHVNEKRLVTSR